MVTGASSGIGYATARLFAQEGAKVVLGARRKNELEKLLEEINEAGGHAAAVSGDVREEAYAKTLVEEAMQRFGGLDIAFNNAGILGPMGPISDMTLAGWTKTIETNLTSGFLGAKYQIPAMIRRGGGSVIFTSTFVGQTAAFSGMSAYAASKAGLVGLTQALAVEFGPQRIRVNALVPGGTDTPMGRTVASTPEAFAYVAGLHALQRIATPDEQAQSVLYLAFDASSFTTGTAMLVDGGISVYRP